MMSPLMKKALRGLAAPASRDEAIPEPELIARPRPAPPASRPSGPSAVLRPLPTEPPPSGSSPVLRPVPMDPPPAGPAVLRALPVDEPAPRASGGSAVLRPLPAEDAPQPVYRVGAERFDAPGASAGASRRFEDSGADERVPTAAEMGPMPRVPRPVLKVGPSFIATFGLVTFSQMASALLASAAGAGSMYAVARVVSPGVAEIPALCVFGAMLIMWLPAAVRLASSAAWRGTLREPGVARGLAEGIAWTVVPRSVGGDPAGLGLYGLRERVRMALEQALFESVRAGWVRRCVSQVAARRVEDKMHQVLGPVEGYGQLDRSTVRKALTNAIEGALVGRG